MTTRRQHPAPAYKLKTMPLLTRSQVANGVCGSGTWCAFGFGTGVLPLGNGLSVAGRGA